MKTDLLNGNIKKSLILFCIPVILSMLATQLYSTVDTMIVGLKLDENAIAALSNASTILMFVLFISGGFELGGGLLVASYKSKGEKELCDVSYNVLFLDLLCSLLLMILGILLFPSILKLINTPHVIIHQASQYGYIYLLGLPFVMIYALIQQLLIGFGDSRSAMVLTLITSVLNIILDFPFIDLWAIRGAALATILSQVIGCFYGLYLYQKLVLHDRFHFRVLSISKMYDTLKLSIPNMIQQMSGPISSMIQQSLLGTIGVAAIAGFSCSSKVMNMFMFPIWGFYQGLSIFIAQNDPVHQLERIKEAKKFSLKICEGYSFFIIIICYLFAHPMMRLFTDSSETILYGVIILTHTPFSYPIVAIRSFLESILKGYQRMNSYLVSNLSSLFISMILILILVPRLGFKGFYISTYITCILAVSISYLIYKKASTTFRVNP